MTGINVLICAVFVLIWRYSYALRYEVKEDTLLGHSRDINGMINWNNPPTTTYHGLIEDAETNVWSTSVNFAKSIILSSTRSQSFPYELIRRIIKNKHTEDEISTYQSNINLSCSVGGLLIFLILASFILYITLYFIQRRRKKYIGQKPLFTGNKLNILLFFGIIFSLINFIFVLSVIIVNSKINNGIEQLDNSVFNSMEDVTKYFNQTHVQYDFMTYKSGDWFTQVLKDDVNDLGHLIWQPGYEEYYQQRSPIFDYLNTMDKDLSNVEASLTSLKDKIIDVLNGVGDKVKDELTTLHQRLSLARNDWSCIGCDGSCATCQNIVPDDIYLYADFFSLPNLTDSLLDLKNITKQPFRTSLYNPKQYLLIGMGNHIQLSLKDKIEIIQNGIRNFQDKINDSISGMKWPTEKDFLFDQLRPDFSEFYNRIVHGNNLRNGFTIFFVLVNILVSVLLISLLCILLFSRVYGKCRTLFISQEDPYRIPRKIMIGCCTICVILSVAFLGLAIGGFYIGANLERVVCQTSKSYKIVDMVLDVPSTIPDYPGYFMGEAVLGNGTLDLKLGEMLRACEDNIPSYKVLKHNQVAENLQVDLDAVFQMDDLEAVFDDMYIDLVNVSLLPTDFDAWHYLFHNITSFDQAAFEQLFNRSVTKTDFGSFINNIHVVLNTSIEDGGPMNPSKDELKSVLNGLSLLKKDVAILQLEKDNIETLYYKFVAYKQNIQDKLNSTRNELLSINEEFWNKSSDFIKEGLDDFRSGFRQDLRSFRNISNKWINEDIGLCQPITDAYKSVRYGFCEKIADFENAEWLLEGHTALFLVITAIFVLLTYRSFILDTSLHDDINTNFEKMFGKCQNKEKEDLIGKAMYRVKNSISSLPSNFSGRRRSSVTPITDIDLAQIQRIKK